MKRAGMSGIIVLLVFVVAFAVALYLQIIGTGGRVPLFSTGDGIALFVGTIVVIILIVVALIKRNNG